MSVIKSDEDQSAPGDYHEPESLRKRIKLEKSTRKSWSLTGRRTEQEVLQEMGVGLLEQDDCDNQCDNSVPGSMVKPNLKRKYDIENLNPNVNSGTSPLKNSPGSPCKKLSSPNPGSSKSKSSKIMETDKYQHLTDQQVLETTLLNEYLIDEETPLAQSVSADYVPAHGRMFESEETDGKGKKQMTATRVPGEEYVLNRPTKCHDHRGEDTFLVLSDEMMLSIFRWLPKRTLAHCMLVCKRWHRVASDETLWQRLDLGNKTLSKDALGRILSRKPVVVRLAYSEIMEWHPTTPVVQSRIQYLDLSIAAIDQKTLDNLLQRCTALRKLSLENLTLCDSTCELVGKCVNLETLNLTMAHGITANGLKSMMQNCPSIASLNISWCYLSMEALEVLVAALPQRLQRLNVAGARIMTDDMVGRLVARCPKLLELDLSDCSRLGADSVVSVLGLNRLEHLALSRCYLLPPQALTQLGSMPALQYLEIWGMLHTTSLNALRSALPAIQINQFMFSAIARPTVGTRRTSIWGLRTRD